jgi:hypothetical protein
MYNKGGRNSNNTSSTSSSYKRRSAPSHVRNLQVAQAVRTFRPHSGKPEISLIGCNLLPEKKSKFYGGSPSP